MTTRTEVKITVNTDQNEIPAGRGWERGVLIELEIPSQRNRKRAPVNLALVIDRSGSMSGGRLAAALDAAVGITSALDSRDRLSLVSFDDEIITHFSGLSMDSAGRDEAISVIQGIRSGGTTNLAGGWLDGADQVARAMERYGFDRGHVVVLSDGKANQGLRRPEEIARHAHALLESGISSSAVGIGSDYSPLQLDAIAEGGGGRLHDAANPEEIVEVVLGELGEVTATVGEDAYLEVQHPMNFGMTLLNEYPCQQGSTSLNIRLGALRAGSHRIIALLAEMPAREHDDDTLIKCTLRWSDLRTGERLMITEKIRFRIVPESEFDESQRNESIANRVMRHWQATVGFRSMKDNEAGQLDEARTRVVRARRAIRAFGRDLSDLQPVLSELRRTEHAVSRRWDGRSKRDAMARAKKFSKSEIDHRVEKRDWQHVIPD